MAGEIIALGSDVKGWKQGDRVCANFAFEHIYGDVNEEILRSAHGGQADGVLTEFKTFPAYVSSHSHLSCKFLSLLFYIVTRWHSQLSIL